MGGITQCSPKTCTLTWPKSVFFFFFYPEVSFEMPQSLFDLLHANLCLCLSTFAIWAVANSGIVSFILGLHLSWDQALFLGFTLRSLVHWSWLLHSMIDMSPIWAQFHSLTHGHQLKKNFLASFVEAVVFSLGCVWHLWEIPDGCNYVYEGQRTPSGNSLLYKKKKKSVSLWPTACQAIYTCCPSSPKNEPVSIFFFLTKGWDYEHIPSHLFFFFKCGLWGLNSGHHSPHFLFSLFLAR